MADDKPEKKEEKPDTNVDNQTTTLVTKYADLLKWAVGTKSVWAVLGALVVGLAGAIVSIVFVAKGRKLAAKQHKAAVAKEKATQKKEDLGRERNTKVRDELSAEIKEAQADGARLDAEVKAIDNDLAADTKRIKEAVSWENLQ